MASTPRDGVAVNETPHSAGGVLLVAGQLFLDLAYSALPGAPVLGEELWTDHFGWGPGGIANFAIVGSRMGVPTMLSAAVGEDDFSRLCLQQLVRLGVDVGSAEVVAGWRLPVTAALAYGGDRALVTGGTPAPISLAELLAKAPQSALACVHLDGSAAPWLAGSAGRGTKVFADVGWDPAQDWDASALDELEGCYAFLPNHVEAMAYTRTDSAESAVAALAERVPLAVVTRGSRGVLAIDSATGEQVSSTVVPIDAVDSTGAGDVFGASLAIASLTDWDLRQRIDFASLVAAITVSRPGGAMAAPRADELVAWLDAHPTADTNRRFAFIRDSFGPDPQAPFAAFAASEA
jgi:ribokinase